jgi:hypothetical protein
MQQFIKFFTIKISKIGSNLFYHQIKKYFINRKYNFNIIVYGELMLRAPEVYIIIYFGFGFIIFIS